MTIDHLKASRGLILQRAIAASVAGLLPVPYLDELLAGAVRGALLRRIAEIRGVDLDANAIAALEHPRGSHLLSAAGVGALAAAGTRRQMRRIAASLLMVRRADEALQTWQLGTLFDHYCARHHLGLGLDGARAAEVRAAIDTAVRQARSEMVRRAFARGLRASGTIALLVPRAALALWARRKRGPIEAETVEAGPGAGAPVGLLRRAARAVEAELSSVERGYLEALTSAFDAAFTADKSEGAA